MNTTKIIVGGLVLIALAFYGGVKYSQSTIPVRGAGTFSQNGVRGQRAGGGIVNGEVLSKDTSGVTIKMRDGGSKIIFISESTSVMKSVIGSQADIVVGKQINVMGTANPDGSVTAQNIQIRQATTTSQ